MIYANKHLLARALINIIDNGLQATEGPHGHVHVKAFEENGKWCSKSETMGEEFPEILLIEFGSWDTQMARVRV